MDSNLTPEQKQAVLHRGSRLLVSAAAGSGKTKVLVDRLMEYLTDPVEPANIDAFLMITYTKAAAAELRGKIAQKLSERIAQEPENRHLQQQLQRLYLTKISTVHSFCGDILREYAYKLDIAGDFRVADENETREIRTQVLETLLENAYETAGDDPDFWEFVDTQGLGRDDSALSELILRVYDSARCHLLPEKWLEECIRLVQTEQVQDPSQTVYGAFLIGRLHDFLDMQISAMEHCAVLAAKADGFDKPAALLADTVLQLKKLRSCDTWDQIVENQQIDYGRMTFSKKCTDEALKENIKAVREDCKKSMEKQLRPFTADSRQVLADMASVAPAVRGLIGLVRRFDEAFSKAKRGRQVMDFGDLEHITLDLLLGKQRAYPTAAAREIGSRFREVMVDEYQDSNAVQDAIYGALTKERGNLFMVGDVKQSIYQFRLADPDIFLQKYASFRPAAQARADEDAKVLLSRNFRSGGGVLAAANDVFRLCMCPDVGGLDYTDQEALHEGFEHVSMGEAEAELYCIDVVHSTYHEEAAFVADRICRLLDGSHYVRQGDQLRPIKPEDIAILLRSPGSSGSYFQAALDKVGLRCATGGGVDLLQEEEIAALWAILKIVHNPMQDIPLLAAMATPVFGFTADDLARLRSGKTNCAFLDAVRTDDSPKSKAFLNTLSHLREVLRTEHLTGLLEQIFLSTNMESIYAAMDGGETRVENLHSFFQLAAEFECSGNGELGRFLEHLDSMAEKGLMTAGEQTSPGCVTIMSIHKSKGLEFPVVFLCGLARSFNMESQRANVLCHKEMCLGLSAANADKRIVYPTIAKQAIAAKIGMESISEEMRVLYVAMTRARDRLIMTYASDRLEKEISSLVTACNMGIRDLSIRQAGCPGQWILLTALQRTEAYELFALGGKPEETNPGSPPWNIRVVKAPDLQAARNEESISREMPEGALRQLQENLSFRYAHQTATCAPSKQTATQRKGRQKDQEAAENAPQKQIHRQWRKPSFVSSQCDGTAYGTATHAAMQYIDYFACADVNSVKAELVRLEEERFLTPEQRAMVDPKKIAAFFETDLGRRLRSGGHIEREFKFSILDRGESYDPELVGEQVLLQGVVDCALIEDDGIILVDFKTDHVTPATVDAVAERYRLQVESYAQAMERIFCRPVKRSYLYFFQLNMLYIL